MPETASKSAIRLAAMSRRKDQPDKDEFSAVILGHLQALPEYAASARVAMYVHVRTEVRTESLIRHRLAAGLPTAIPYCQGNELRMFQLQSWSELSRGSFGILEPRAEWRRVTERHWPVEQADLIVVPGVAFDRRGYRVGYGKGYFDRLLVNKTGWAIGLAFDSQIVDQLPVDPHDQRMDEVVTQSGRIISST